MGARVTQVQGVLRGVGITDAPSVLQQCDSPSALTGARSSCALCMYRAHFSPARDLVWVPGSAVTGTQQHVFCTSLDFWLQVLPRLLSAAMALCDPHQQVLQVLIEAMRPVCSCSPPFPGLADR